MKTFFLIPLCFEKKLFIFFREYWESNVTTENKMNHAVKYS